MHEGERRHEPAESSPRPERDARVLSSIVDIEAASGVGSEHNLRDELGEIIARTPAEEMPALLEKGVADIRADRKDARENWTSERSPAKVFRDYLDGASRLSHAIQCSVNKEVDLGIVRGILSAATAELPEERKDGAAYADGVRERQIRMNALMSDVYTADMLRRIGLRKGDTAVTKAAMAKLDGLRPELLKSIDALEQANADKVRVTPGLPELLMGLRAAIANAPHERLEKTMYDEIADPFSMAIGYDIEDFNEREMIEALERLEG